MSDHEWPEPPPFKDRLALVIGRESVSAFARRSGVPESTLRTYLSGRSLPGLDAANKIATAGAVSRYWLTTGMGAKEPQLDEMMGWAYPTQSQSQAPMAAESPTPYGLSEDERALLENYRAASSEGKRIIRAAGAAAAKPKGLSDEDAA